jgi:hypothetical protein
MDLDSVLLSVQERDKWRRRLEFLQATLLETRQNRIKSISRLRRIKQEISKLAEFSETLLRTHTRQPPRLSLHATRDPHNAAR